MVLGTRFCIFDTTALPARFTTSSLPPIVAVSGFTGMAFFSSTVVCVFLQVATSVTSIITSESCILDSYRRALTYVNASTYILARLRRIFDIFRFIP